jgi:histidine triad (HIT) family protein
MCFVGFAPFHYILVCGAAFGAIPSLWRDGIAVRHHIAFSLLCYALKSIYQLHSSSKKHPMTIFSKIIKGDIPCHKIAETDKYFAFLDISPLAKGHVLVVPKQEVDYIFDLDAKTLAGLMTFSKKIAKAIKIAIPCKRVGVAVIGLEVPHAHVHLIPLQTVADINFERPKMQPTPAELAEVASAILGNL